MNLFVYKIIKTALLITIAIVYFVSFACELSSVLNPQNIKNKITHFNAKFEIYSCC